MDEIARRAEFARSRVEAHQMMAAMRAEMRANRMIVAGTRRTIDESWELIRALPERELPAELSNSVPRC